MKLEHFALNVPDARAHAAWYVKHLGFSVARGIQEPPFRQFLADETGRIGIELYTDPRTAVPDYASLHPLAFHVAVVSTDAEADRRRLRAAGATAGMSDEPQAPGNHLVMLRDPWGVPLQLCQRSQPF